MQQKYVYAYNGVLNWFRGALNLPMFGSRIVTASPSAQQVIWRNHYT
jgi:hypothetical protein